MSQGALCGQQPSTRSAAGNGQHLAGHQLGTELPVAREGPNERDKAGGLSHAPGEG